MIDDPRKILQRVRRITGGTILYSKKGVPHLIVNDYYSVCYLKKTRIIRVFDNCCFSEQKKVDFKEPEKAGRYVIKQLGLEETLWYASRNFELAVRELFKPCVKPLKKLRDKLTYFLNKF